MDEIKEKMSVIGYVVSFLSRLKLCMGAGCIERRRTAELKSMASELQRLTEAVNRLADIQAEKKGNRSAKKTGE